jgi:transglutaminase-like putative cysteine protease
VSPGDTNSDLSPGDTNSDLSPGDTKCDLSPGDTNSDLSPGDTVLRAQLRHRTAYHYDRPVRLGPQLVRLRPLPDPRRGPSPYRMQVDPAPSSLHWQMDPFGNVVGRLVLGQPVAHWALEVSIALDMTPRNAFDVLVEPDAQTWPFRYDAATADALSLYRRPDHAGPEILALQQATRSPCDSIAFLLAAAAAVRDQVGYIVRMEAGVWPVERTLEGKQGSCRDSAWVLVQLLRMHGIASRFVSGYLVQFPDDSGQDSAELHAWAEAYLPGAGWLGLDATSGLMTAEGHVGLAASPDVAGAAPLEGTVEPADVRLETSIIVTRP